MAKLKLVVLSGAGMSAESGLQTFRNSNGLWEGHRVEDVATPEAWHRNPQLVLDFYNQRRKDVLNAKPNAGHLGLAMLEDDFEVTVITQNVDDLHERAGSKNVVHLHGEIFKMCSEVNPQIIQPIRKDILLGDTADDGHQFRPFIVWFGEPVVQMEKAAAIAAQADIFIVIGTSLAVYPAAGLVHLVPPTSQKFIIDKKIPTTTSIPQLTIIEKPATEGVAILQKILKGEQG